MRSVAEVVQERNEKRRRVADLQAEMDRINSDIRESHREERAIRESADADLERVIVNTSGDWGRSYRTAQVIVKRTEKTIFVRPAGIDAAPTQFRKNAHGVWASGGWRNRKELRFINDEPT